MKKVIIIGAGLAGLAASKKLIDQGFNITLLESREMIGGKVSAWQDSEQDWIESGLHVFFGSYQCIFDLMREVDIYQNIVWQTPCIQYKMPGGGGFKIVSHENLPCPLNLLPNFFFDHQFTISDLIKYCKAIIPILKSDLKYINAQDHKTFFEWVQEFNISQTMMERMFLPMTLSLKFLPLNQISAQVVLNVFRLFISNPKGFKIGFLNGSPAQKLTGPIADYLIQKGANLCLGQKVCELKRDDLSLKSVVTSSGEHYEADYFVFALPTHKFAEVLTPTFKDLEFFQNLKNFTGVPVANAQFWLSEPLMTDCKLHFGTAGITPVFADMSNYYKKPMIESVIAPFEKIKHLSDAEILNLAWEEIKSYFPKKAKEVKLLKSSLVKIPHSVYAPYPRLEKLRPTQKTPIANLFLAGGFTKGHEFFDSMEGAVSSGFLAAQELVNSVNNQSKSYAHTSL